MPGYETIEVLEAINLTPPAHTFLINTFFPTERTHVSEKIEFDVKKGKRIMAPFVSPRIGGKIITRMGFVTKEFSTPRIAPERIMTVDDLSKRVAGENIYSNRTPEDRETEFLAEDIRDLEDSIARRKEWMARQILFYGKLDIVDQENGIDIQADFQFDNSYQLNASTSWKLDSVNPMHLLKRIRRNIIKNTGQTPDTLLFSSDAIEEFMENPYIEKEMNLLKYKNIVIEPKIVDSALTYYGRIQELGLDIYTYDEWFIDDDGKEKGIIPEKTCLMISSKGVGSVEYGLISQYEDKVLYSYEAREVPKIFVDGDVKKIRLTSRPLPRPFDVNSWAVIHLHDEKQEEEESGGSSMFFMNGIMKEEEEEFLNEAELNSLKKSELVAYGAKYGLVLQEGALKEDLVRDILNHIEELQANPIEGGSL